MPTWPRWIPVLSLLLLIATVLGACGRTPQASPTSGPAIPAPGSGPTTAGAFQPARQPAQPALGPSISFAHLPPEAGLSQSVVTDLLQDNQGFIWLGTQDGLNRYDGSEFKIYKHDPRLTNGLTNNYVTGLEIDSAGSLWIGTNAGGLNRFDPSTGIFSHYLHNPQDPNSLSENAVSALLVDPDGTIWIGTSNSGLNALDPVSGTFTHYQNDPNDPASLSGNTISALRMTTSGELWVGTGGTGLNRLDRATGRFSRYSGDSDSEGSLNGNFISALYQDRQGTLWIGTTNAGLYRYVPETDSFVAYRQQPADPASLSDEWITVIFEDSRGQLWIGTYNAGLNVLDRPSGTFTHIRHDPYDPQSLAYDNIASIYEDHSGTLWFGTFGSGVDLYDPQKNKFSHYFSRPGMDQGLSADPIWAIYEDPDKILWIGTMGGGLNRVDLNTGVWSHFTNDPQNPASLNSNNVFAIYRDRRGVYWFGTDAGVNRFDPVTEEFTPIFPTGLTLSILEDQAGNFWLGSALGLYRYDPDTGDYQLYTNNPDDPTSLSGTGITVVREDQQGNLWIGTFNAGLNRYDPQTQSFVRYQHDPQNLSSLSDNSILTIFPEEDGTLWIGTAGGLSHLDPKTGVSTSYREADGLPNDFIYGILKDEQGDYWISTNRGISRFKPNTQEFTNYDAADGLQGLEFNQGAYFQNQDGVIYFGGVRGLDVFHPEAIGANPYAPPVVITGFQIHQEPVRAGPDSPLKQPIEATQDIRLAYTDNTFEFSYAALHYSSPEGQEFAYILEGYEDEWNYVGNRRVASYTKVSPGNYTFRVKGANSDGVWNESGAAIAIILPPPFWQTLPFQLLVAALVIGGVYGAFLLRIRSVEHQRRQLEVQVAQRTHELRETMAALEHSRDAAEAANRAKSTFLANISHEFRTPLNAILGFTQVLVWDKSLPAEHKENLEIIHRSSEHLLGLINDVLEISKIEAGRLALTPRNFDLRHMLEGLEEMFRLRAEDKGLELKFQLAPEVPAYVRADEGKLRQVLMNLLGNAVKFTQQGTVSVRVGRTDDQGQGEDSKMCLCFEIADTGPGIAPEEMAQLFTPFVQTSSGRQVQEGTGLGLPISQQYVRLMGGEIEAHSEVGNGSRFKFELPVEVIGSEGLETPRPTRRVTGLESGQPAYRLLVVDDQAVNRKLLVKIFTPVGFEVREAANGKEAVEIWEEWSPQLIWMDMRMPVMDGYEATRRIKATSRGQATVIIALTASGLEEEKSIILSEGCDDYMRKPFREVDLFEAISRHLGARYVYEEVEPQETTVEAQQHPALEIGLDLPARLARMDRDWLSRLEHATVLGEQGTILELLNEIAGQDSHLAAGIAGLAEKFDHDRILALIQKAHKG